MTMATNEITDQEIIDALEISVSQHLSMGGQLIRTEWGLHINKGEIIEDTFDKKDPEDEEEEGSCCLCLLGCLIVYPPDAWRERVYQLLQTPEFAQEQHVENWESGVRRFLNALLGKARTQAIIDSFDGCTPVPSRYANLAMYAAEKGRQLTTHQEDDGLPF